ncbi:iron transporter [Limnobaculum zhutongyuii]|uniref:Iron transporter n=1 Tax=Limnobaculum zhutongyuii TaxID=2498113 RepID=A0A411WGD8_9GAMM|nr:ABC transporter substrate-binding protein [Limnobaculum zhutongyuii]QBH95370.1 iron transporter [Limnobaculum zhutongyuii]TQS89012.1 iron transporter [Limnobaculum zhutongyuii]
MLCPVLSVLNRLVLLVALTFSFSCFASSITVTDIADRQVTLNAPVSRVILADSRALVALNILNPQNPLHGIIAWDNALQVKVPDMAQAYSKKFPAIDKVPVFANPYASDFSVERALKMKPDLVIFDTGLLGKLRDSGTLNQLEKSGVPVIFIDFRQQPLTNTVASIRLLGKVFGEEKNGEKYISFYQQRLSLIQQRIATLAPQQRPTVFIERHAGMTGTESCCHTFGKGNFGEFIQAAGGNNLGSQWFETMGGEINEEQLITSQPRFYLMTAADWSSAHKGSVSIPLGYGADEEISQKMLKGLMERRSQRVLTAVKEGRVMAFYHQFYDSPFNIAAVEAIAKFLHPTLFPDLDPLADLKMMHREFSSLEYQGLFWINAK